MSRYILALATTFALISASAVEAREKEATTPSGRPEMVFAYTQMPDAVSQVSSACMDYGWMVTSQINNQVVCEIPMGVFQSTMTKMLIGNRYSSTPKSFVRFSLGQVGENTRIQAQAWSETQMAFGQIQHHQHQDDGTYNNLMNFMGYARAQFPIGTSFNSKAYLGVNGEAAEWKNGRRNQYGWKITILNERTPAYRMGLRDGDILAKINNRLFKDDAEAIKLLDRQRLGQPLSLTVVRDGQPMTFEGIAEGRPPITLLVKPEDVPQNALPAALQFMVAHTGSLETALSLMAAPEAPENQETATEPAHPEDELDLIRREAADAQAKLIELEARLAKIVTTNSEPQP